MTTIMNTRQAAAYIAEAYANAGRLVAQIDAECTGSGSVVEITGPRSWRIVGNTEQYRHLAAQSGFFALRSTGSRKQRIEEAVEALDGQGVGQARAYERRDAVITTVAAELSRRSEAAGLDPDNMFSGGVLTPIKDIAERLVDIAIGRIQHATDGLARSLTASALSMVPGDVFGAAK